MKIISKFKDYYDFLQGKYGIDPLKILDRTLSIQPYFGDSFEITFCNTTYGRIKNDNYYERYYKKNNKYEELLTDGDFIWYKSKEINNFKQPIVKKNSIWNYKTKDYTENNFYNFSLEKIGFNKIMSPEECYLKIEEFLGKIKDEAPQTIPTDLNRFEAKGFDKKTSFRNM